ncbi:GNAT family N-acetyltransferase [Streptomyces sp. Ru73]|uniref:GNAT family N-acetyltransferase n=1 Tax=Streptomyces sp. Ru73 TaxID=2080748 RepID=UPI000CDDBABB|nr:GNAT family N-acetyltransferase [Streptomyces sp. Ru73]POX42409.1 GNAT family N-acetyltransferase [Streptomyces sp. Ru73]
MTQPDDTPTVERNDAAHRYDILLGGTAVGYAEYRDRGDQRIFHHTVIDDAFAGRGLASLLVRQALTDVHAAGKRIVPVCPYVAKYLGKHDEFNDITDPVTRDVLEWLKAELA